MIVLPLAAMLGVATAQVQPVKIRTTTGQEGTGFVIGRQSVCVAITAAHVVADRVDVAVVHASKEISASVQWNGAKAQPNTDVAIVSPNEGLPVTCKYLADATVIENALVQPLGQLWVVGSSGETLTPRVTIAKRDPRFLTLTVLDEPERYVVRGVSGAAVTFDGKIVAVVSGNDGTRLVAERLDAILRAGSSGLSAPEVRAQDVPKPYDLSAIADRYAEPARKARAVREEAERVSKLALDVERLADEAASFANDVPLGQVVQGHGRFSATNGNFYAGQVTSSSQWITGKTSTSSQGFGVTKAQTGDSKGRVTKCAFAEGRGCRGPSVIEWPSGRWSRAEAEFVEAGLKGPSRFQTSSGETCFASVVSDSNGNLRFTGYGVNIEPDGRRFEGEIGPTCNWEGFGVLWNKDGGIIRVGRWRAGQTVED